jgi:hypothetical protein
MLSAMVSKPHKRCGMAEIVATPVLLLSAAHNAFDAHNASAAHNASLSCSFAAVPSFICHVQDHVTVV